MTKKRLPRWVNIGLCLLLVFGMLGIVQPVDVQASSASDEFDTLRAKWLDSLTGGAALNTSDSDIAAKISTIATTAQTNWDSLNKDANRTYLFPNAPSQYPTKYISSSFSRLQQMALAYSVVGSPLYHNLSLRDDIISGLDWLYANWYNETIPFAAYSPSNNWYDWEIASPIAIVDTLCLMYNDLTSTQISNYMTAISHFTPNPTTNQTSTPSNTKLATGANLSDKSMIVLKQGILAKDGSKLASVKDALIPLFRMVKKGNGFYEDGSFVQHDYHAYTLNYGNTSIIGLAQMLYLLNNSSWQVINPESNNLYHFLYHSFESIIYKNTSFDNLGGRTISFPSRTFDGYSFMTAATRLTQYGRPADVERLKGILKYYLQEGPTLDYSKIPIDLITSLKAIANDSNVQSRGAISSYKQFNGMDRSVLLRPGFGFGISMFSNRISNYESLNYNNLKGWNTANGRTTLLNDDFTQYALPYFGTVDMYRLPGTTVNHGDDEIDALTPQISQITVQNGQDTITDPLNDWSLSYSHTSSWQFVGGTTANFEGDTSRIRRKVNTTEEVVYNLSNLTVFKAKVYYNTPSVTNKINLYTSANGQTWSKQSKTIDTPVSTGNGWFRANVSISSIPAGTQYAKIELVTDYTSGLGDQSWVGGTDIEGKYGISGMQLHPVGQTLMAKKSWFMFDNEIVALGSDINGTDNKTVETIVDNYRLNDLGDNALTVNGTAQPTTLGWSNTASGTNWIHRAGNVANSDVGYYFPGGANVSMLREARTGSYQEVDHNYGSTDNYTSNYMTMWLNHGRNPANGAYAYVILPNMTSTQVSHYASNPDVSILENSSHAQAVKQKTLNIVGVNFWKDMTKTVDLITSDKKASVMTKEAPGDSIEVSVSDPTQENKGIINIELNRSASYIMSADPGITVTQLSPTIKLSVLVNGAAGKAFKARFNLNPNAVMPVPSGAAAVKLQSLGIVDNAEDWSQVYSTTNNWAVDSSTPSYFEGDFVRLKRTTNTPESMVYHVGGINNFSAKIYAVASVDNKVKVYASPDNLNYVQIPITHDTPISTGTSGNNDWYRANFTPAEPVPAGTNYLKIEFSNDALIKSPQLSQIIVNGTAVAATDYSAVYDLGWNEATSLTTQFDVTPGSANDDQTVGYTGATQTISDVASLPIAIRFNGSGTVDVKNDFSFQSLTSVAYTPNQTYHVRMVANLATQTYDVYVTPPSGTETQIAANYAFKAGSSLTNLGQLLLKSSNNGGLKVQNHTFAAPLPNIPVPQAAPDAQLTPTDDAFVRDGTYASTNYGSSPTLELKTGSSGYTRQDYIKFDLSSLSRPIASAKLGLYMALTDTSSAVTTNANVYSITYDDWTEGTITYNNKPATDALLGNVVANRTYQYVELDITDYIKGQYAGDKLASFAVIEQLGLNAIMNSKESSNKPYINIQYTPESTTYYPSADAYVQSGTNKDTNFGANTSLVAKRGSGNLDRQSYLKFDLSSLSRPVTSAKLGIYIGVTDGSGALFGDTGIYSVGNDSWTETGITYSNKPPVNSLLARFTPDRTMKYVEVDVTSFVQAQYAGDKTASFAVIDFSGQFTQMYGKEIGAAKTSYLKIVTN
ncbi:polysaccharide lyase family 8 super-sandwich domain-containing protein [Paenibacillus sp. YYML68]|uniref:CBM96 family carbohydrate-binding protein n=1 Tax=Paenibacillus sp. YYML68 TaxID=2909250 RepID=UPI00248F6342|nr:polysaccharide lyase family 8 super-sandwich domain-containing protein [Paenibacillus sp. YYML68]